MVTTTRKRRANGRRAKGTTTEAPARRSFLAEAPEPIREALGASVELEQFLGTAGTLTLNERRLLVEQALILLEQNYVHLPLKAAMHAVNPLQRLRLLSNRLERQTSASMDPEWKFHAEMSEIFHSVRDLHTNYLLPVPFSGKVAYLPFMIEQYFDAQGPRYIVTKVVQGFAPPGFGPGAEIRHWSGVPIERAVETNANRFAGSNAAARRARGIDSMPIRALRIHLPPDEHWVTVGYIGTDGAARELREQWRVVDNLPTFGTDADAVSVAATVIGLDLGADEVGRARRMLFARETIDRERAINATGELPAPTDGGEVPTSMQGVFRARTVATPAGTFGHIRIFTFSVPDPGGFVAEFVRLVKQLPQTGLIVDVRGNGGGHIFASELTLQTLTPRRIEPEPVQFINTPLNLKIVKKHRTGAAGIDLGAWFSSMDQALQTGAVFSGAFPITPADEANAIGQEYSGPVVLITDARCYSATDIFAAGFQDHKIGPVLGVDDNTGAGGANVWTHALLKELLDLPSPQPGSPYRSLPKGANMRVSIRRTLRVGPLAGTPVEDLGITPDHRHRMTKADLLNDNADLLARAGQLLASLPIRTLVATATAGPAGTLTVQMQVSNVDRADVFVDGRPRASIDVSGTSASVTVSGVPGASSVRVEGYAAGELVASDRTTV
jgi:hypothetical protein